jgi:hypothetical protein
MENDFVYAFMYCPCIHESAYATVSLHRTEKGAEVAMEFHKNEKLIEYEEYAEAVDASLDDFGQFEKWAIKKIEIHE